MNIVNGGVPDDDFDSELPDADAYAMDKTGGTGEIGENFGPSPFEPEDQFDEYEEYGGQEPLRRQLAQFAFVREEDDREVRLTFRDVPANEIARAFRGSGALLMSMMGERVLSPSGTSAQASTGRGATETSPEEVPVLKRRNRKGHAWSSADDATGITHPNKRTGELTMRYFFSLSDLVYTINIIAPTGVVESIADVYPVAALSERELQSHLAVVFREIRS